MADNNNQKNKGELTPEDALAIAGSVTAQFSPLIGAILGSALVADVCLFGGVASALVAVWLKGRRDGNQK